MPAAVFWILPLMPDLPRRTFLAAAASAAAAACACASCPLAAAPREKKPAEPVDVGTLADFPRDGAYDAYVEAGGFFLVRAKGRLYAVGADCTHKATPLKVKEGAFACPKHGARFDLTGKVIKAPAKRPLPRYAISLDGAGHVIVDASRTIEKDKLNDDGSFVEVK
jgi:nitrite reductase/ring-hydroxylating ferredoxin subunit